ncbi:MAG TPA: TfoX/Sxy family protein [Solirubrobacteraceae bacterium]|jgi:TfoX/Sxy family transcriptional regulator of competence genes|nr:TfoX/Sxy family protein [Solirubrobacteraceae bacterium]
MPYEEDLAHRVRELIGDERGLSEMRMFGGLAFLLDGNMAVAVSSKGGLMLRHDPEQLDALLAREHARPMIMRGRPAKGWLRVDPDGVKTKRELQSWVRRGVEFARTLPPKGRAPGA